VTPPRGELLGTVIVRFWVESGSPPTDVRARVLVVRGADAELQEIGIGAGVDAVLSLVSEGLLSTD
jgi:hypothetical protein